eukprot:135607_1
MAVYAWHTSKNTPLDPMRIQQLKTRWLEPLSQVQPRKSMQQQIECATTIRELIPIIEHIGVDDMKKILSKYYDNMHPDSIEVDGGDTKQFIQLTPPGMDTARASDDNETDIICDIHDDNETDTIRLHTIRHGELLNQEESPSSEIGHLLHKKEDIGDEKQTEMVTLQISNEEQQKLIELYETNQDSWREQITTAIRKYHQPFVTILERANNNNNEDGNGASLTMERFQQIFASLDNNLSECMFADIVNIDNEEDKLQLMKGKTLKYTTILDWIDINSSSQIFKEVEFVNDGHFVIALYEKLDKYLEY